MTPYTSSEFLDDPGAAVREAELLWPAIRHRFLELESKPADTAILGGGLGWGKSTLARLRLLYALHRALETPDLRDRLSVGPDVPLLFQWRTASPTSQSVIVQALKESIGRIPCLTRKLRGTSASGFSFEGHVHLHAQSGKTPAQGQYLGGVIDAEASTRSDFLATRTRMRAHLGSRVRGSLTWCREGRVVTSDDRTEVLNASMYDTNPLPRDGRANLWVQILADEGRFLVHETPPRPCSPGQWFAVPAGFEPNFRADPATAVRDLLGFEAV